MRLLDLAWTFKDLTQNSLAEGLQREDGKIDKKNISYVLWNILSGSIFRVSARMDFCLWCFNLCRSTVQISVRSSNPVFSDYQQSYMLPERPESGAKPKCFLSVLNINTPQQDYKAAFTGRLCRKPIRHTGTEGCWRDWNMKNMKNSPSLQKQLLMQTERRLHPAWCRR